jgi:hypothetical protein
MTVKNLKTWIFADVVSSFDGASTSLTVGAGQGARFPATTPFNALLYDRDVYENPADAWYAGAAELVSVTDVTEDVLTVERAQEGGSAAFTGLANHNYRLLLDDTA